MGKLQSANRLFEAVKHIRAGLHSAKGGMLEAGRWLSVILREELWKHDGSPSKSFSHWIENEISLSKSTAYNLIDAFEKVGDIIEDNPDFKDLDMSKVFLLLPHIDADTSRSDREEMLHMAQSTTWRGLKDNLREMEGKPGTDKCDHMEREMMERCKRCGKWIKA